MLQFDAMELKQHERELMQVGVSACVWAIAKDIFIAASIFIIFALALVLCSMHAT